MEHITNHAAQTIVAFGAALLFSLMIGLRIISQVNRRREMLRRRQEQIEQRNRAAYQKNINTKWSD